MSLRHVPGRGGAVEIELDGVRHQVTLRREGGGWIAGIDGREVVVGVAEAGGQWSLLVEAVPPPEGGSRAGNPAEAGLDVESGFSRISYEIAFDPGSNGELIVYVNGVAVALTVVGGRRRGSSGGSGDAGPRAIVAPMPGRIVKVLVKVNEAVAARQPLVVIEAMKMENELRAPRDGTVADVRVTEGASVEANTILVVLE